MNEVFRLQKSHRNLAIVGLFFFSGMMAMSVYLAATEGNVLLGIVFGGFWSFWIGLSVWLLLAYYRESLTIQDGTVVQRGVLHTKSMKLSELVDVQWKSVRAVVLRSRSGKATIHLDNFTPEQRLEIIRWLHGATPLSIQRGWDRFCYVIAMPLLQRLENYPIQGHGLIRWHIDRIFILMIPLVIGTETAAAWYLRNLSYLFIVPVPFLLLWLVLRAGIPAKGTVMPERKRLDKRFLLELAIWGAVGIVGAMLFDSYRHDLPYPLLWVLVGVLLWFAVLLIRAYWAEQRMWHGEQNSIKCAVEEWERYAGATKVVE